MRDAVSRLLDDLRLRDVSVARITLDGHVPVDSELDGHGLVLVAVTEGSASVTAGPAAGEPLAPGDVALSALPSIVVGPVGDAIPSPAVVLVARYAGGTSVCTRVLQDLPEVVVVREAGAQALADLVQEELAVDRPGRSAVVDRLLELLVAGAVRGWVGSGGSGTWMRSYGDPVVGAALRLMHDDPGRPWTVAALAAEVGVSRTSLARQFTERVGESPMSHLTCWRMCVAADFLADPGATVDSVATSVGYADAFSLSRAFKRVHGISPSEHRRQRSVGAASSA